MTQTREIHRLDDGSIDFRFYRALAAQLRREQRSKIVHAIVRGAVNLALTLMSRAEPIAARREPPLMHAGGRRAA
jgi:hypothetical protein